MLIKYVCLFDIKYKFLGGKNIICFVEIEIFLFFDSGWGYSL